MEKLAFLFTGQGAQYVGMGQSFYENHAIARQTFEEAGDVLGFDLSKLCFQGGMGELTRISNAQPAHLTVGVVAFRVYMEEVGVAPQFLAGHSLGEYAALTCAGAIRFADALKIVRQRGLFAEEVVNAGVGGMTIVDGLPRQVVDEAAATLTDDQQLVMVNCDNAPTQMAIAGHQERLEELESRLLDLGGQVTPLLMSAPFHTPLMNQVAEQLREVLQQTTFHQMRYPVIANVDARPYGEADRIVDKLTAQTVRPVRWRETMQFLKRYGVTHAIEMGPKNVLCNLVSANVSGMDTFCYAQREDRHRLKEIFNSEHPLTKQIPTVLTRCLAAAVAVPNQNVDGDAYRKGVIEPYRQILQRQEELEQQQAQPTTEQMREALAMLRSVFVTKKVSVEEQREWFHQILEETGTYYLLRDEVRSFELESATI